MKLNNLFDFATKELSQDAFLCWLFSNYKDKEIGPIAKELLIELISLSTKKDISPDDLDNFIPHQQAQDIDIVIDFTLDGKDCILAIEDKVNSKEHNNQLTRYKRIIEKWNQSEEKYNDREMFLVYYKTNDIDEEERLRISDAGWKEYPFERIAAFWRKHSSVNNLIVKQYIEHIEKLWSDSQNVERPNENNINQWTSYYKKVIVPALLNSLDVRCDLTVSTTRFGYVNLKAFPCGKKDDGYPFLEIRSRDCLNDSFQAKFLMYDVETDSNGLPLGLSVLREAIKNSEHKGIFEGNYGEKQNKQVAHSPRHNQHFVVKNDSDFVRLAKESIEEYLRIVDIWHRTFKERL